MAVREIDENEYAEMKRVYDVAAQIGKNPEARQRLQEAVAIAVPEQAGPEIRIRNETNERFSKMESKLDEFLSEQRKDREAREADDAKRALETRWAEGQRALRAANYTEEGIVAIEKLMTDRGIPDHEAAAAYYEKLNPPPEPVSQGGSRFNFFDHSKEDVSLEALMRDPFGDSFLDQAIPAALKEVRGR